MTMGKKTPEWLKIRIIRLREEGLSVSIITERLCVHKAVIYKILKDHEKEKKSL